MCHSFHYIKRVLETLFVHRISHGTMPLRNIFKVKLFYAQVSLQLDSDCFTCFLFSHDQIYIFNFMTYVGLDITFLCNLKIAISGHFL